MDRFVVFFDAERPLSHFGWGGAFCGAEPVGDLMDRHGWGEVTPCPACAHGLPEGERHIFRHPDGAEALCGALRAPGTPMRVGIDPYDPALCDRCWTLLGAGCRLMPEGYMISLMAPRVFVPSVVA